MSVNLCKKWCCFYDHLLPQKHYNEQMLHIYPNLCLDKKEMNLFAEWELFLSHDFSINWELMNFNGNEFRIPSTETPQALKFLQNVTRHK